MSYGSQGHSHYSGSSQAVVDKKHVCYNAAMPMVSQIHVILKLRLQEPPPATNAVQAFESESFDGRGNTVHTAYNPEGRVVARWGATYPVLYAYDAFGDLATLTTFRDASAPLSPEHGDTTRWLRDAATGLVTNKLYADDLGPSYTYTPDGKLATRTWARGVTTYYSYNANRSLTNVVYSDNTPSIAYAYDNRGNIISATVDGVSTNLYAYDVFGNMTNEVQNGTVISRDYDAFGRPTGYALGSGGAGGSPAETDANVAYSYDALGRFASVTFGTNVFEYSRLPGTDLVSGYTCGSFSRSVSYEPQRDLISAVTNSFGSSLISAFDYANDAAGRRISRLDIFDGTVITNLFGYNTRSEVTSALMGTNTYGYAYDPIGNRLTSTHNAETNTYAANSLNQYIAISDPCASAPSAGEITPTYDADGNMTSEGRGWRYFWNAENRMVMASNDAVVVTYAYDHRGRMVRKDIQRIDAETQRVEYTWDNWNIIQETTADLSTLQPFNLSTSSYVWGLDIDGTLQGAGGVGGLLTVIRDDGVYLPTYDANGNVSEYITTNGEIIAHYDYSPFGELLVVGPLASATHFRFSTKLFDNDTGYGYWGHRWLSPSLGRWLAMDPIAEMGGKNLYAFARNRPIILYDKLGMVALDEGIRGVKDCGVILYLTHNYNVALIDVSGNKGCRRAGIATCKSASKIPGIPDQSNLIDIPLSEGNVGIGDTADNGGKGPGMDGYIAYMLDVMSAAAKAAEGLCPPDYFLDDKEDNKNCKHNVPDCKCRTCDIYRASASLSYQEGNWLHYDHDIYQCCHCTEIQFKFFVPKISDNATYIEIIEAIDGAWGSNIHIGNGGTRTFDCKKKKWSGGFSSERPY